MRRNDPGGASACRRARVRGFALVSALFVLVVLSALGAAMAVVSTRQQLGSAAEVQHARALQGARAGLEWAAFQLLRNPAPPAAAPGCFGTTSFAAGGIDGYTITVRCVRTDASDGGGVLVSYQVVANACNVPDGGACPSTAASPPQAYVERQLTMTLAR